MKNGFKSLIIGKFNVYFWFVALALAASAYLLILDNQGSYVSEANILVSPKNEKTAIQLESIKENMIILAKENLSKDLSFSAQGRASLIKIQTKNNSKAKTQEDLKNATQAFLNLASKYYDVKNDLSLEIASAKTLKVEVNKFAILLVSLAIGLVLSLVVQLILDLAERLSLFFIIRKKKQIKDSIETKKYWGNFFEANKEKIQKLSEPSFRRENFEFPVKKKTPSAGKANEFVETNVSFKKASFPANLPVAEEDLEKIAKLSSVEEDDFIISQSAEKSEGTDIHIKELQDSFKEPTEEDFKKRLNQLLGNK